MKRKTLTLILTLALFAIQTLHAETYSGDCGASGNNVTWSYDTDTQTLAISGTGAMVDYEGSIGIPWWDYQASIQTVTIGEGVTHIGNLAFNSLTGLTSVSLPSTLTSIGSSAFIECLVLPSIVIPEGVTSIGVDAFNSCEKLTSITLPSTLKSIENKTFMYCKELGTIVIPEGVTSIGDVAFNNCVKLTSVSLPSTLKSIGERAFGVCSKLDDITIPDGVTSIGDNAFGSCISLSSITIPAGVTSIGSGAFYNCTSLNSVTIPAGVTSIETQLFLGCSALESVNIPESVTSIGKEAFSRCSKLTSITIPSGVTSLGYEVFFGCSKLTSITIPEGVTNIDIYAFKGCSGLPSIVIPSNVQTLGQDAFKDCTGLKSVTCLAVCPPAPIRATMYDTYIKFFDDAVSSSASLTVPEESKTYYQAQEGWKEFKTISTQSPVTLTVRHADMGEETYSVAYGHTYTLHLSPVAGTSIASLEFNTTSVLSDLKDGAYTTPVLTNDATIQVTYSKAGTKLGDIDGDGKVDVSDVTKLVDLIMNPAK